MNHLMDVYQRLPVSFEKGEGVWLWDLEGNQYLDALSGFAVCGLGHAHPAVTKAIQEQAGKLLHTSNAYHIPNQIKLATALCRLSGLDQALFVNSGSEAIEVALKLARLYGHQRNIDAPLTIVMENAYHGRTLAALSASDSNIAKAGLEPLMSGFIRVPYNDWSILEGIVTLYPNIVAVLVEPIQGAGGIKIPDENYLVMIREICDKFEWLMIIDEVQTGMARTGHLFAFQSYAILPDILVLAKGLGNGLPIGACLAKEQIACLMTNSKHNSTFGGNPLATMAALATIQEIEIHKLWENARKQGENLMIGLKQELKNLAMVKEIRGRGLIIGIELMKPCREIPSRALEKRLLLGISNDNTLRLLPPLIIEKKHVEMIITIITDLIHQFSRSENRNMALT